MTSSADEKAALAFFIQAQRRSVMDIVHGLGDDEMHTPVLPSGWTPSGMIEHLGRAELFWFQHVVVVGGAEPLTPAMTEYEAGKPFTTSLSIPEVMSFYQRQAAQSDAILARTSLDASPAGPVPEDMAAEIRTVRDVALHIIEETARHAGHLDIVRELIDGHTGLGPR